MSNQEFDTVIGKFNEAVEAADAAALQEIYSDDLRAWHNFDNVTVSKSATIAALKELCRNGVRLRIFCDEQFVVGNRGIRRQRVEARTPGGQCLVVHVALFVTVEGGQISRVDEYMDSKELDALGAAIAADLKVASIN
jgi:ketosteroid isomerase-like protein